MEPFKERGAHGLQIGFAALAISGVLRILSPETRNVAVQSNGSRICGHAPLGGAEKHADMPAIQLREARRRGTLFERAVHSSEDDFVLRNMNNDPTTGECRNDFVVRALAGQLGFQTVGGEAR